MLYYLSVNFAPSECVFNILSKVVLSTEASADILNHVEIGKNMYEQYVEKKNEETKFENISSSIKSCSL